MHSDTDLSQQSYIEFFIEYLYFQGSAFTRTRRCLGALNFLFLFHFQEQTLPSNKVQINFLQSKEISELPAICLSSKRQRCCPLKIKSSAYVFFFLQNSKYTKPYRQVTFMNVFLKNTEVCVLHHIALNSFLGIQNTA